jgi:type VI secretion system Hcp family effector
VAIYMKYGSIMGDATAAGFQYWINIHHFNWPLNRSVTNKAVSHGHGHTWEASRPKMQPFVVKKEIDAASTELLVAMCCSTKPECCTIAFVRTGLEEAYAEYTFYESLITAMDTWGEADRPIETITFAFAAVEVVIYPSGKKNKMNEKRLFPNYSLIDHK